MIVGFVNNAPVPSHCRQLVAVEWEQEYGGKPESNGDLKNNGRNNKGYKDTDAAAFLCRFCM
jgi:hypothetical protein